MSQVKAPVKDSSPSITQEKAMVPALSVFALLVIHWEMEHISENVIEIHGNRSILTEKWKLVNNLIETHMPNEVNLRCVAQAGRNGFVQSSFCEGHGLSCPL